MKKDKNIFTQGSFQSTLAPFRQKKVGLDFRTVAMDAAAGGAGGD